MVFSRRHCSIEPKAVVSPPLSSATCRGGSDRAERRARPPASRRARARTRCPDVTWPDRRALSTGSDRRRCAGPRGRCRGRAPPASPGLCGVRERDAMSSPADRASVVKPRRLSSASRWTAGEAGRGRRRVRRRRWPASASCSESIARVVRSSVTGSPFRELTALEPCQGPRRRTIRRLARV